MSRISGRISKLESKREPRTPAVRVVRHIVTGVDETERQAKIEALTASSSGNELHIIRTIVSPHHRPIACPA